MGPVMVEFTNAKTGKKASMFSKTVKASIVFHCRESPLDLLRRYARPMLCISSKDSTNPKTIRAACWGILKAPKSQPVTPRSNALMPFSCRQKS